MKENRAVTFASLILFFFLQIEELRQQTKADKKHLAISMRKKQLGALGMTVSCFILGAGHSSVFAHCAVGRLIDSTWWTR